VLESLPLAWTRLWSESPSFQAAWVAASHADAVRRTLAIPPRPRGADAQRAHEALFPLYDAKTASGLAGRVALRTAWPEVERLAWVRWHLLEDALRAAFAHTDLHDAAFILRTMTRELGTIERVLQGRAILAEPASGDALDWLEQYIQRMVLPATRIPSAAELVSRGDHGAEREDVPDALRSTAESLNPFVHPNAPAHELGTHPERAAGPTAILRALATVYDYLASLPGVAQGDASSEPGTPVSSYAENLTAIVEAVIPAVNAVRQMLGRATVPPDIEAILAGMTTQAVDADVWAHDPVDPAVVALSHRLVTPAQGLNVASLPRDRPELGLPQVPTIWAFGLPGARRARADADRAADSLPLDPEPTRTYFEYLVSLVTAAASAVALRDALAAETLARQIARGNPLGTAMAARAVLESRAVGMTAIRFMDRRYVDMQRSSRGADVGSAARGVEEWALSYLTANRLASQGVGGLARRAILIGATTRLDATSAIEAEFPEGSSDRTYWHRLSRTIKGPQLTGGDVTTTDVDTVGSLVLAWGIDILTRHCTLEANLRVAAQLMSLLEPLRELVDVADDGPAEVAALAQTRQRPKDDQWLRGFVDGDGTADSPYRSRRGRTYQEAVRKILQIKGLQPDRIQLHLFADGTYGDRVTCEDPTAVLYFSTGDRPPFAMRSSANAGDGNIDR
jgi:hypothetical protein